MRSHLKLWPFALTLLAFVSCLEPEDPFESLPTTASASDESNQIVWDWTELYLNIERDLPGFRPAPTCRAMAYINMGGYETAVPGMEHYRSLSNVITGFPTVNLIFPASQIDWEIALNAYYARTLKFFLFNATQEQHFQMDLLENTRLSQLSTDVPAGIVHNSIDWGRDVANAIITFSETDREGATQCHVARPLDYFPAPGDGKWIPTNPDHGAAMFPYWGKVRAFASHATALPPYYPYSTEPTSAYYKDNLEVSNAVKNLSYEDRWIAEFWSDDITGLTFSPPARIFAIANQVIKQKNLNLEETLHLYCKMGIAINDGAVAAWRSKYIYNTERPETYITKYIDPGFKPILGEAIGVPGITPSFPGYPSGHSTFAGISWRMLEHFFGSTCDFTDYCHEGRVEFNGYPRHYNSWKELAEENAYSRIPLGVHIRMDCIEGLRLGNQVAVEALDIDLQK